MPTFSVIIPLYNKSGYVLNTIDSVLAQSFEDFEIVVVDDGSSDNGPELVRAIADPRIRLISQTNAGVSVARNNGIAQAKGDWICFLDADDWYHPVYLAAQHAAIMAHPTAEVFATEYKPIADAPYWRPVPWALSPQTYEEIDDLPRRWMIAIPFFTGSITVRRATLLGMQPCFPVGESYGEDLDLWFRLAETHPVILSRQPLVAYRTAVSGSLANSVDRSDLPPFLSRLKERAIGRNRRDPKRRSALDLVTQQYITQARHFASIGKRRAALHRLLEITGDGARFRRWWATLFMAMIAPAPLIYRWQAWRKNRTMNR
jgi:glycosyltransferase involved in cell wall biosynthesis